MNAVPALLDNSIQLFDPGLTAVIDFPGRTRAKATGKDREDQGSKYRGVAIVEGTVDEHVVGRTFDLRAQSRAFRGTDRLLRMTARVASRTRARTAPDPFFSTGFKMNWPVTLLRPSRRVRGAPFEALVSGEFDILAM